MQDNVHQNLSRDSVDSPRAIRLWREHESYRACDQNRQCHRPSRPGCATEILSWHCNLRSVLCLVHAALVMDARVRWIGSSESKLNTVASSAVMIHMRTAKPG